MYVTIGQIPRNVNAKMWATLIAPRPIALISTVSADGCSNIAPFSSVTALSTNPPMLGVSFSQRDGNPKKTLENIKQNKVFSVNLVPRFLAEIMNKSAEEAEGVDDFERLSLTKLPSSAIDCPRIGESPATLECKLVTVYPLPPSECEFVTAEILGVFIRDEFVTNDQGFDPMPADLLGSVGTEDYLSVNGETIFLPKTWG